MNSPSLLPVNATSQETAIEQSIVRATELPVAIKPLWHAQTCDSHLLPWLAWTLSVDQWDSTWSDDQKRNTVSNSFAVHQIKGTVGSVRRVLQAAGYGKAEIVEGLNAEMYDGAIRYSDSHYHGEADTHWAMYRIYLRRPISNGQATQVRQILAETAPIRCQLAGLHYTEAANLYDHTIFYDDNYAHGVA